MPTMTFQEFVEQRFGGRLSKGAHDPNGAACVNEALNVYLGKPWGDCGFDLDLRGLNDAPWSSDEARTASMLPVGQVILAFQGWSPERRQAFAKRVAEQAIRRIVPIALRAAGTRLPSHREALEAAAQRCADEGTAAAWAARAAAWAAAEAAGDAPLREIARVLVEAAEAV